MSSPDIVYICRDGQNEELRYSLRSLTNVEHGEVWVIGGRPDWYVGEFIQSSQKDRKLTNARRALRAACTDDRISDPFLYFNDDFYAMKPGGRVRAHHRGPIRDLAAAMPFRSAYTANMLVTASMLERLGNKKPISYELHVPMLMRKAQMLEVLDMIEEHGGGQERSLYGNLAGIGGTRINDVKIYTEDDPMPRGRWLSSSDKSFHLLQGYLMEHFDRPSDWETR